MAAAMMAAAFVLIVLRGRPDERRPRTFWPFLAVFVGQGLALVASSMLRLDLYVEAYSLTLWRVMPSIMSSMTGIMSIMSASE